jgi:hypothetical protein
MTQRPTVVERAFELARSGQLKSFSAIRRHLSDEGYLNVRSHFDGRFIKEQLLAIAAGREPGRPKARCDRSSKSASANGDAGDDSPS